MGYSNDDLNYIFDKTNGNCRHCGKQLAFDNYGDRGARGAWEVDHSNPKAKGGTDHMRNLWALCWQCNLDKRDTRGSEYHDNFEPRTAAGKVVEFFGGRAGDWGTDPHRDPR
ncbi:MAG: HNH endonuclease [Thaumarchaeota archaeon]|nr:HNH endonuclease [Nitrososphaerota archaeon]